MLVCLLTTTLRDAALYRLNVSANDTTGLREPSQIMVEKIMAARRDQCGPAIGRVDGPTMAAVGRLLGFVVGLAD